jgi:EH domain-containing protein 1
LRRHQNLLIAEIGALFYSLLTSGFCFLNLLQDFIMNEKDLQGKIHSNVNSKLAPLLAKYNLDLAELDASLKWKPIVLILGNYSSGKSTFINELIGKDVQRTGQAPTDDSFTLLTAPSSGSEEKDVPGADLVNDERMPFTGFKVYGEKFISHFQMKQIASPVFDNLALIDSPGMLDSISENDRGYDYTSAVKSFAKLADLIILMFDPHKAGTIQETYNAIRNTLPEATGEDRIVFVMSRIDECDNIADLVRSYGTLCWNLSQMTGRKDIPRVFLTYSPGMSEPKAELAVWAKEREELKEIVLAAPGLRISHILQDVDKNVHDMQMAAEAMWSFTAGGKKIVKKNLKNSLVIGLFGFLFLDLVTREFAGFPDKTLISSLLSGYVPMEQLIIPLGALLAVLLVSFGWLTNWQLPRYFKRCRLNVDALVTTDTEYRKNVWSRVRGNVVDLLKKPKTKDLYVPHGKNLIKLEKFSKKYIQKYYEKIRN